jgi:hypothetical protein
MLGHLAAIDERAPEDPFIMTSFFNISAATFWVSQRKPPRLVVTIEMYSFSVYSTKGFPIRIPALLIRVSMRPKRARLRRVSFAAANTD